MQRPAVDEVTAAKEVQDWYWTRAELDAIARRLGIGRAGSKADLTARLVDALEGRESPVPRIRSGPQLKPPFNLDVVVPPGQRMTRELRTFLVERTGPGFRFDAPMREFFTDSCGRTLRDAIDLQNGARAQVREIGAQFEYNRFTRAYRGEHPDATSRQVRDAWASYKATPISRRGRV